MASSTTLPPLSLSILGVEPLDEFIKEIADFVHHMIMTRPDMGPDTKIEVEAKIGVLRDAVSRQKLILPLLVETSKFYLLLYYLYYILILFIVLVPDAMELVFESNMSAVSRLYFYM